MAGTRELTSDTSVKNKSIQVKNRSNVATTLTTPAITRVLLLKGYQLQAPSFTEEELRKSIVRRQQDGLLSYDVQQALERGFYPNQIINFFTKNDSFSNVLDDSKIAFYAQEHVRAVTQIYTNIYSINFSLKELAIENFHEEYCQICHDAVHGSLMKLLLENKLNQGRYVLQDPVEKLENGFTIFELLLQGYSHEILVQAVAEHAAQNTTSLESSTNITTSPSTTMAYEQVSAYLPATFSMEDEAKTLAFNVQEQIKTCIATDRKPFLAMSRTYPLSTILKALESWYQTDPRDLIDHLEIHLNKIRAEKTPKSNSCNDSFEEESDDELGIDKEFIAQKVDTPESRKTFLADLIQKDVLRHADNRFRRKKQNSPFFYLDILDSLVKPAIKSGCFQVLLHWAQEADQAEIDNDKKNNANHLRSLFSAVQEYFRQLKPGEFREHSFKIGIHPAEWITIYRMMSQYESMDRMLKMTSKLSIHSALNDLKDASNPEQQIKILLKYGFTNYLFTIETKTMIGAGYIDLTNLSYSKLIQLSPSDIFCSAQTKTIDPAKILVDYELLLTIRQQLIHQQSYGGSPEKLRSKITQETIVYLLNRYFSNASHAEQLPSYQFLRKLSSQLQSFKPSEQSVQAETEDRRNENKSTITIRALSALQNSYDLEIGATSGAIDIEKIIEISRFLANTSQEFLDRISDKSFTAERKLLESFHLFSLLEDFCEQAEFIIEYSQENSSATTRCFTLCYFIVFKPVIDQIKKSICNREIDLFQALEVWPIRKLSQLDQPEVFFNHLEQENDLDKLSELFNYLIEYFIFLINNRSFDANFFVKNLVASITVMVNKSAPTASGIFNSHELLNLINTANHSSTARMLLKSMRSELMDYLIKHLTTETLKNILNDPAAAQESIGSYDPVIWLCNIYPEDKINLLFRYPENRTPYLAKAIITAITENNISLISQLKFGLEKLSDSLLKAAIKNDLILYSSNFHEFNLLSLERLLLVISIVRNNSNSASALNMFKETRLYGTIMSTDINHMSDEKALDLFWNCSIKHATSSSLTAAMWIADAERIFFNDITTEKATNRARATQQHLKFLSNRYQMVGFQPAFFIQSGLNLELLFSASEVNASNDASIVISNSHQYHMAVCFNKIFRSNPQSRKQLEQYFAKLDLDKLETSQRECPDLFCIKTWMVSRISEALPQDDSSYKISDKIRPSFILTLMLELLKLPENLFPEVQLPRIRQLFAHENLQCVLADTTYSNISITEIMDHINSPLDRNRKIKDKRYQKVSDIIGSLIYTASSTNSPRNRYLAKSYLTVLAKLKSSDRDFTKLLDTLNAIEFNFSIVNTDQGFAELYQALVDYADIYVIKTNMCYQLAEKIGSADLYLGALEEIEAQHRFDAQECKEETSLSSSLRNTSVASSLASIFNSRNHQSSSGSPTALLQQQTIDIIQLKDELINYLMMVKPDDDIFKENCLAALQYPSSEILTVMHQDSSSRPMILFMAWLFAPTIEKRLQVKSQIDFDLPDPTGLNSKLYSNIRDDLEFERGSWELALAKQQSTSSRKKLLSSNNGPELFNFVTGLLAEYIINPSKYTHEEQQYHDSIFLQMQRGYRNLSVDEVNTLQSTLSRLFNDAKNAETIERASASQKTYEV